MMDDGSGICYQNCDVGLYDIMRMTPLFRNSFLPAMIFIFELAASVSAQDSLHTDLKQDSVGHINDSTRLSPAYILQGGILEKNSLSLQSRKWLVAGTHAAIWAGSYITLNNAWYAGYPKSRFHFFNDWDEWGKMDKLGHVWTAYNLGRVSGAMWKWTGMNPNTAVWLGGASALAYQSIVEVLDGYSSKWGFSMGDVTANIIGAGAYVAQELAWKDQRIQIKLSYWPYDYPANLVARRNELSGSSPLERILKDYNSQTYWLSANLKSFLPETNLPAWLSISVGYNSRLMLGGSSNIWKDKNGNIIDRSDIQRYRRIFLAPDIDLSKINTKSKLLRSVFSLINMIKVPLPALEFDTRGKFLFHPIYF